MLSRCLQIVTCPALRFLNWSILDMSQAKYSYFLLLLILLNYNCFPENLNAVLDSAIGQRGVILNLSTRIPLKCWSCLVLYRRIDSCIVEMILKDRYLAVLRRKAQHRVTKGTRKILIKEWFLLVKFLRMILTDTVKQSWARDNFLASRQWQRDNATM